MENYSPEEEEAGRMDPPPKQVLLFLGATVFLCMMLGSGIVALACNMQGVDLQDVVSSFGADSDTEERNFMRGALLINHLLSFMVPALLTGWVFFRRNWPEEVGVSRPPATEKLALGVLLMIAVFPLAQLMFSANSWLVEKIKVLDAMVEAESASVKIMEGLIVMESPVELIFSLLVIAVVPAVGEELLFRGLLQKQLEKLFSNPYMAVLLTAFVFGLAHFQVQRFFAIFLLGLILGLLFLWTRNLWISIAGHFVVNGTQVLVAYFMQDELGALDAAQEQDVPLPLTLLAIFAVYFIGKKLAGKNGV